MEVIKNYILSLVGFSFISSLACAILPEIPAKKTVKFICGIILSLLILSPIKGCEPEFGDIFTQDGTYNLYSSDKVDELTREMISDKVSEIVGKAFEIYGISGVGVEVMFDEDGNITAVNIDSVHEQAAKDAAEALGIPYELMHMSE